MNCRKYLVLPALYNHPLTGLCLYNYHYYTSSPSEIYGRSPVLLRIVSIDFADFCRGNVMDRPSPQVGELDFALYNLSLLPFYLGKVICFFCRNLPILQPFLYQQKMHWLVFTNAGECKQSPYPRYCPENNALASLQDSPCANDAGNTSR